MNSQINNDFLFENGFTASEIERLNQLRDTYKPEEETAQHERQHRLEFVRWLVLTGKLTEDIA